MIPPLISTRTRDTDAESKFAIGKFGSEQERKWVSDNEANADDEEIIP